MIGSVPFQASRKYLIISAVVLSCVNSVLYRPVLESGFWSDEYHMIAPAARLSWQDFLVYYVDPRVQWIWYRPVQGIEVGLEYALFGSDARGYHVIQLLLHCLNSVILLGLATHVTHRWRIGFVAALIYITWSVSSLTVFWPGVGDPLLALFFLWSLWFWIRHLETGQGWWWGLACIALVGGLGTKENAVVLPIILFLADRWLVGKPTTMSTLVARYAPLVFLLLIYCVLQLNVVMTSAFTRDSGYGFGSHVIPVVFQYLLLLAFPWETQSPLVVPWLATVLALFFYLGIRRHWQSVFLGVAAVLTIAPVMLFQGVLVRYLYLPLMACAVGYAILFEKGLVTLRRFIRQRLFPVAATSMVLLGLTMFGSVTIADAAQNYTGFVRQTNLKLRPIFLRHPSFDSGTLLYFVDLPFAQINVAGAMSLRYGRNVTVDGRDGSEIVGLANYKSAFVYYVDDDQSLKELSVDASTRVRVVPGLPANFEEGISLRGFELTNSSIKSGEATVLLLYWSLERRLDKDYTVFMHLLDGQGNIIAGSDSQPKRGTWPTSRWSPGELIVDAAVLPVGRDTPIADNLRLEIGMYYLPTMQRLSILDSSGQGIGDSVVFEPFSIVP